MTDSIADSLNIAANKIRDFFALQCNRVAYLVVSSLHEIAQYTFSKSGAYARVLKAQRISLAKKIKL